MGESESTSELFTWHEARGNAPNDELLLLAIGPRGRVSYGFAIDHGDNQRFATTNKPPGIILGLVYLWGRMPQAPAPDSDIMEAMIAQDRELFRTT
jgi:hypothetical protein